MGLYNEQKQQDFDQPDVQVIICLDNEGRVVLRLHVLKEGISLQARPTQVMTGCKSCFDCIPQAVCTFASHCVKHHGLKEVVNKCHGCELHYNRIAISLR